MSSIIAPNGQHAGRQINVSVPNLNGPSQASEFPPLQEREVEAAMLNVKKAMALNVRDWADGRFLGHIFDTPPPCRLTDLTNQLQALILIAGTVKSGTF